MFSKTAQNYNFLTLGPTANGNKFPQQAILPHSNGIF